MAKKIIGIFFLISTLWVSAGRAHEITAEFCRKACDSNGYAGWCFPLGTGAKKFSALFNAILAAATAGDSEFKIDSCDRKIVVTGSNMSVTGAPCSVTQEGFDLELTSELSGVVNGTITNDSGVVEINFIGSNLKSGFKTSKDSSFGRVSFVTTKVSDTGDKKVIWGNGEWCFSGYVKP